MKKYPWLNLTVEQFPCYTSGGYGYISHCHFPRIKQFLLGLFKGIDWFGEFVVCFEQHTGEFNASKLADFGAALTTADEPSLQEVLEELDVKSFFYTHL
jgi:hypothetical protein